MTGKEAGKEFTRINQIVELLSDNARELIFPHKTLIGDDAAVLNFQELNPNLFAADMLVENVHFKRSYFNESEIGYKSISTNVSDMAAMGGRPLYSTISLAIPPGFDLTSFIKGVVLACEEYGVRIAGGDLSGSELVVVSIAMIGSSFSQPLMRSTAQPNDYIFVTGALGSSAAGFEILQRTPEAKGPLVQSHKMPKAKLREAEILAKLPATSTIDISDGLIADLNHLCEMSSLGAILEQLPIYPGATLTNAMFGGEDYELIFSHPNPDLVESEFAKANLPKPFLIGRFSSNEGITLKGKSIEPKGFQHEF